MIRSAEQVAVIEKLSGEAGDGNGNATGVGKLTALVRSVEDVKSEGDARRVLGEAAGVDYVVWSAGEWLIERWIWDVGVCLGAFWADWLDMCRGWWEGRC